MEPTPSVAPVPTPSATEPPAPVCGSSDLPCHVTVVDVAPPTGSAELLTFVGVSVVLLLVAVFAILAAQMRRP